MFDVLKVSLVFASMLILLRLKWSVGPVLLLSSLLLALLYLMPPAALASTAIAALTDPVTIKLLFALTLIKMFELVLRERQVLARMMAAARKILKRKRAVIVSMPLLIGMLPSLGGAYFSAPMVAEASQGLKMTPEEKSFVNYWFRHPWETVLPLYPGILLASALTGIELHRLIAANMLYALSIVITGFAFSMHQVKGRYRSERSERSERQLTEGAETGRDAPAPTTMPPDSGLVSFVPVGFVLAAVLLGKIELHYALGIGLALLFIYYKYTAKEIVRVLRHGVTLDVVALIFGVMLFKFTMENSGAVGQLSGYFTAKGIPLLPILFLLPFISGMLTGLTVGFVGSTFPLVLSLGGGAHLNQITFAFAAGFVGVLLSPVHLCLVLTREYFKADLWGVYRRVVPAAAVIVAAATVQYFIL